MNLTDKLPRSAYDDLHPGVRLNVSPPSNKKEEEKVPILKTNPLVQVNNEQNRVNKNKSKAEALN